MPLNEQKILEIILEQCRQIPERCEGYQDLIIETIADIVQAERQHNVQATNIQQKINDWCSASGRYLSSNRGTSIGGTED